MTVDIEKLQAKLDAATPGEWNPDGCAVFRIADNRELVAAMKNALPELLAMARENAPQDVSLLSPQLDRCGASWGDQKNFRPSLRFYPENPPKKKVSIYPLALLFGCVRFTLTVGHGARRYRENANDRHEPR